MRMHVYEAVEDDSPTVLLIHPMLSSASRMKAAVADHMGSGLRFLIPDLSAHGDETSAPLRVGGGRGGGDPRVADVPRGALPVSGIRGVARRGRVLRATALPRSVV